jgi:hypothetical protein
LKKELEESEMWVKKITNEYDMLKKQFVFNGNNSINAKSIELGMITSICNNDPLSDFYFEKLKKSEAEIIKVKKMNNERKIRFKS